VAIAVAVVVGVAAVALSAGGERHQQSNRSGSMTAPHDEAPLLRIIGVLRREQTAADRTAWVRVSGKTVVPRSERLAGITPWKAQVILFMLRRRPFDTVNLSVASRTVTRQATGLRSTSGGLGWTAQQIEAGQAVLQVPGPLRGRGPFTPRATRLFMIVPDGVARVAFLNGATAGAGDWVPVAVHSNVAFAQLTTYCCGPSVVARWYRADGRLIKVTGGPSTSRPLRVLKPDGIGSMRFGAGSLAVRRAINVVVGQAGGPYTRGGSCGVDHQIKWWDQWTANGEPALTAYFHRGAFVGYQYGELNAGGLLRKPSGGWRLATSEGLRVGDTLARGRRLYGSAFSVSAAQGGSWNARVAGGVITGYAMPARRPGIKQGLVETIDAGDVGCPAVAP
jgi:hypothetical protein